MAEIWCVVRKPTGDESPYVGPFTAREEAKEWAEGQISQGREVYGGLISRSDLTSKCRLPSR